MHDAALQTAFPTSFVRRGEKEAFCSRHRVEGLGIRVKGLGLRV